MLSFEKNSSDAILTHSWEEKGVHTFPKGISLKVNVIARLEFELAYYDSAVQRFNYYSTRISPKSSRIIMFTFGLIPLRKE